MPGRGLEEYDRRALGRRGAALHLPCHAGDLQVVQSADESAFYALVEKV